MPPKYAANLQNARSVTAYLEDNQKEVILSMVIGGSMLLHSVLYIALRRIARNAEWVLDEKVLTESKWPTFVLLPTVGAKIAWRTLSYLDSEAANTLVQQSLSVAINSQISWLLVRLLHAGFSWLETQNASQTTADKWRLKKVSTQLAALRRTCHFFLMCGTLSTVLFTFPEAWQFGLSMMASAGAAGVVLGLAATPGLQTVMSSLTIAFSHSIAVDDELIIQGEYGRVEDICSQYVVLRLWDGRRLIVPLTYLTSTPFQNWTKTSPWKIGTALLYFDPLIISRLTSLREHLTQVLTTVDSARKLWDGKVVCLQVTNVMPDSGVVEVRVLTSARNSGDAFDLRCLIRESLIAYVVEKWPNAMVRARTESRMFGDHRRQWNHGDHAREEATARQSTATAIEKINVDEASFDQQVPHLANIEEEPTE